MRRISQVSRLRETSIFSHTLIAEAWFAVIVLVDIDFDLDLGHRFVRFKIVFKMKLVLLFVDYFESKCQNGTLIQASNKKCSWVVDPELQ